ncbi:hypothetical protein CMUS01_07484 [Colletotrichum musicola]|uniref:Uncharacterized protein n=1 Tax=Colletotrichum musicola TaxID=2175873 RepID=A0A8H6KGH3_9PEZI|nr:hypothetical protein CMUS01_07484 [Colletotrichum musicola]
MSPSHRPSGQWKSAGSESKTSYGEGQGVTDCDIERPGSYERIKKSYFSAESAPSCAPDAKSWVRRKGRREYTNDMVSRPKRPRTIESGAYGTARVNRLITQPGTDKTALQSRGNVSLEEAHPGLTLHDAIDLIDRLCMAWQEDGLELQAADKTNGERREAPKERAISSAL